jgi:hypothetical protein
MPWSQLHWAAFRNDAQGIKKLTKPSSCCGRQISPDKPDKVRYRVAERISSTNDSAA